MRGEAILAVAGDVDLAVVTASLTCGAKQHEKRLRAQQVTAKIDLLNLRRMLCCCLRNHKEDDQGLEPPKV